MKLLQSMNFGVPKRILDLDDDSLKKHMYNDFFNQCQKKSKPLQVKKVVNLLKGHNMFLLAATGYRKLSM